MRPCGRPSTHQIDRIKGMLWCAGVELASGLPHPTAIERRVSPERFKPRQTGSGGYIYPGYFNKIKNGTKVPSGIYVEKVDRIFPGTSYWYYHPFWQVAKYPLYGRQSIFSALRKLESDAARSLILPPQHIRNTGSESERKAYLESIFDQLEQDGSWDALTAIIGFSKFQPDPTDEMKQFFADLILRIFSTMSAERPFYDVLEELYDYLFSCFIDTFHLNEAEAADEQEIFFLRVNLNRIRLVHIEELGLLPHHKAAPASCLHIAAKHLSMETLASLSKYDASRDRTKIMHIPAIRDLAESLCKWEADVLKQQRA